MINEYKYGFFKIDGKDFYDDIKIIDRKVKFWECRTREITLKEVKDLIDSQPQLIIIGLGAGGLITVANEVRDLLRMKKIPFVAEKNKKACELYNQALEEGKKVAALFPGRG